MGPSWGVLTVSSGAYGPTFPQGILFVQTYITCLSIMPSRCWKSMCQNDTKLEPGSDCNVVSKVPNKRNPFNLIIYINNKQIPTSSSSSIICMYCCIRLFIQSYNYTGPVFLVLQVRTKISLAQNAQNCLIRQEIQKNFYENDQLNLSLP